MNKFIRVATGFIFAVGFTSLIYRLSAVIAGYFLVSDSVWTTAIFIHTLMFPVAFLAGLFVSERFIFKQPEIRSSLIVTVLVAGAIWSGIGITVFLTISKEIVPVLQLLAAATIVAVYFLSLPREK